MATSRLDVVGQLPTVHTLDNSYAGKEQANTLAAFKSVPKYYIDSMLIGGLQACCASCSLCERQACRLANRAASTCRERMRQVRVMQWVAGGIPPRLLARAFQHGASQLSCSRHCSRQHPPGGNLAVPGQQGVIPSRADVQQCQSAPCACLLPTCDQGHLALQAEQGVQVLVHLVGAPVLAVHCIAARGLNTPRPSCCQTW